MTTNNHPAHAPLTTRRLHQMRDILSKASAQRDGGGIGYAMSDAVKLIDGAIAAFGAEPLAVNDGMAYAFHHALSDSSLGSDEVEEIKTGLRAAFANVTAKPAPIFVPDDFDASRLAFEKFVNDNYDSRLMRSGTGYAGKVLNQMWQCWLSCRSAMLQAGNSPVIPDGWVIVPVEPTQEMIDAHVEGVKSGGMHKGYRAMLAAAPDFREISNSSTKHFRENAETSTNEPVCETHKLNGVIDENLIEALRLIQCMLDDYRDNNYGHAQSWVRHIDKRMGDYSDVHGDDAYSLLRDLLPAAPQQEAK